MITKTIKIPIYFGKLILILTEDFEDVNKKYSFTINPKNTGAIAFHSKERNEFIIALKDVKWSTISHEAIHIMNYMFLDRDISLDRENDEPQAYFVAWVVNEVEKFLKKHKK